MIYKLRQTRKALPEFWIPVIRCLALIIIVLATAACAHAAGQSAADSDPPIENEPVETLPSDTTDHEENSNFISVTIEWIGGKAMWVVGKTGYLGIIITMGLESACIPIPSEIVMPAAGALCLPTPDRPEPVFTFWGVVLAGSVANLLGSLLAWWVGWKGGRPLIVKYGRYILLSEHDLDRAERWFNKYGEVTVFVTRMMPVIRTFISLPAGIGKMPLTRFAVYTFIGAVPWNLFLTYVGYKLSEDWEEKYSHLYHQASLLIGILILAGIIWFVWHHIKGGMKRKKLGNHTETQ